MRKKLEALCSQSNSEAHHCSRTASLSSSQQRLSQNVKIALDWMPSDSHDIVIRAEKTSAAMIFRSLSLDTKREREGDKYEDRVRSKRRERYTGRESEE
ncbi:hypothetical protein EVAR_4881_1 [Eumeta japonica]|uniref:Uncharacterized protein n=1 Tax=Eumeta variegata TaxID=151549 RepID=A0A4C1T085_EUMVA|nr:hypothetical protein EVAR_4881_1 [Eumeta japonica]